MLSFIQCVYFYIFCRNHWATIYFRIKKRENVQIVSLGILSYKVSQILFCKEYFYEQVKTYIHIYTMRVKWDNENCKILKIWIQLVSVHVMLFLPWILLNYAIVIQLVCTMHRAPHNISIDFNSTIRSLCCLKNYRTISCSVKTFNWFLFNFYI